MIDGQVHASSWQQSFSDKKLSERASDGGARWCSISGSFSSWGLVWYPWSREHVAYSTVLYVSE